MNSKLLENVVKAILAIAAITTIIVNIPKIVAFIL